MNKIIKIKSIVSKSNQEIFYYLYQYGMIVGIKTIKYKKKLFMH